MATKLKKEIRVLMTKIQSTCQHIPRTSRAKTMSDVNKLFRGFEDTLDRTELKEILEKGRDKLNFLEMTVPSSGSKFSVPQEEEMGEDEDVVPLKQDLPKRTHYVMKDGQMVEGLGDSRGAASFSNWYAANADPEDIQRHKELLDRQHFRGPVWDGKPMPKSILDENPLEHAIHMKDIQVEEPTPKEQWGKKTWKVIKR
mmetsp:Transcript_28168/g.32295  ORF Transcript_28168/g.32295 Transcript_28168/m.32295 type:complete len:199 (+) Transcript_28168:46-642(+)